MLVGIGSLTNASTSARVGGRPVRSRVARRIRVAREPSCDGAIPTDLSFANTNTSIALKPRVCSPTSATSGLIGGINAQCFLYSAPWAIQRSNVCFSFADRVLWDRTGGIRISSSSANRIRRINSLDSGWPGTMARSPLSSAAMAVSNWSRRKPPSTCLASGPWQARHLSDKIGRTSRLKSTLSSAEVGRPAKTNELAVRYVSCKATRKRIVEILGAGGSDQRQVYLANLQSSFYYYCRRGVVLNQ